eukprot:3446077-Rhodomonas_salina.3
MLPAPLSVAKFPRRCSFNCARTRKSIDLTCQPRRRSWCSGQGSGPASESACWEQEDACMIAPSTPCLVSAETER